ncbi:hypothetical protein [Nocardia gipuzkoensis]
MRIDSETFEKQVRRLSAENPDFIYDNESAPDDCALSCTYVRSDGNGGWCGDCLIGQALVACGVDPMVLHRIDLGELGENGNRLAADAGNVLRYFGISDPVADWAELAQDHQDQRHTWGASVRAADRLMLIPEPARDQARRDSVNARDGA